jgi:enoyl-CoA hydratase/carnithine racemase
MELKTDRMIAEKDGGIGWMIYNNPARRNAVNLAMREAAAQIYEAYAKDDDVRVLVIRGSGDKSFVSGADISEFKDKRQDSKGEEAYQAAVQRAQQAAAAFDKPVIAMIQGYCIGGGVNVALETDIRIAADNSTFAVPAARLGLGYGYAGLKRLVNVVGPAYAREIMFTARRFDAARALAMGLVNCVVPVGELEDTVRRYAADIAANAPLTIKTAKAAIDAIAKDPAERDLKKIEAMTKACFDSADYAEGRKAFMEKRKPVFTGR